MSFFYARGGGVSSGHGSLIYHMDTDLEASILRFSGKMAYRIKVRLGLVVGAQVL